MRVERRGNALAILAAVAGLAVAACATAPRSMAQSEGARSADSPELTSNEDLANTVYATLNANPTYYFRHVNVQVNRGVADLSGYVWSTDAIYHARTIALSVPGIRAVVTSHLELERNGRGNGVTR